LAGEDLYKKVKALAKEKPEKDLSEEETKIVQLLQQKEPHEDD